VPQRQVARTAPVVLINVREARTPRACWGRSGDRWYTHPPGRQQGANSVSPSEPKRARAQSAPSHLNTRSVASRSSHGLKRRLDPGASDVWILGQPLPSDSLSAWLIGGTPAAVTRSTTTRSTTSRSGQREQTSLRRRYSHRAVAQPLNGQRIGSQSAAEGAPLGKRISRPSHTHPRTLLSPRSEQPLW